MDKSYIDTVRLLLRVTPDVFAGDLFAMKGGTAINLFVRDMPRLSVDIDVVYVNHVTPRNEALGVISSRLEEVAKRLEKLGLSTRKVGNKEMGDTKLLIEDGTSMVKIEVNTVLRGTVLPVERRLLCPGASGLFLAELSVPTLAVDELYGGKLVAALDRQHPRDLFDVFLLFQNGGITEGMIECFVTYLSGHNRPTHEVLSSRDKDISMTYVDQFEGMSTVPVTLEQMMETRSLLRTEILRRLSDRQKGFLVSLLRAEPDWSLLACSHASELPGLKWKLENLLKFREQKPDAFEQQARSLENLLAR
jgi:predicted nucleotidyltransferase component of viral defense system